MIKKNNYSNQFAYAENLRGEALSVARDKGITRGLVVIVSEFPEGSPMEVVDVKPCARPTKYLSDLATGRQSAEA